MAVRELTEHSLGLTWVGDDSLELQYGIRIPVVLVDGRELFEIRVDAGRLEEAVLT